PDTGDQVAERMALDLVLLLADRKTRGAESIPEIGGGAIEVLRMREVARPEARAERRHLRAQDGRIDRHRSTGRPLGDRPAAGAREWKEHADRAELHLGHAPGVGFPRTRTVSRGATWLGQESV